MSLLAIVASRFTTAALAYFWKTSTNIWFRPMFRIAQLMLPGTYQEALLCLLLVWIRIWFLQLFSWGRILLLVYSRHKPEHFCSIPFCLILLLVLSIHPDLLWMGCTQCRAGYFPTWIWTMHLIVSGHKYPFYDHDATLLRTEFGSCRGPYYIPALCC